MYEQAASSWVVGLYSLLDPTKILPFLPNLWSKQAIGSRYPNDTKIRDTDVLVGYLILYWIMLYLAYKKCLNVLLLSKLSDIGYAKATLEICLFPPPTQEAIELAGIHKRHRESLKRFNNKTTKKAELWQTLAWAMAIKKKIKRFREAKNSRDTSTKDLEETELPEAPINREFAEE